MAILKCLPLFLLSCCSFLFHVFIKKDLSSRRCNVNEPISKRQFYEKKENLFLCTLSRRKKLPSLYPRNARVGNSIESIRIEKSKMGFGGKNKKQFKGCCLGAWKMASKMHQSRVHPKYNGSSCGKLGKQLCEDDDLPQVRHALFYGLIKWHNC